MLFFTSRSTSMAIGFGVGLAFFAMASPPALGGERVPTGGVHRKGAAPPPPPLGRVLEGEAKTAYEAARLLYNDGDWAGAFSKFKTAYEASSEPRLLWNMAACEKAQRHYARAYTLVARYLREGSSVISAENRASAEETLKALRGFYSLVQLPRAPPGARVVVDGEEVGKAPLQELPLDLGTHTIRLELEGFEPFETRTEVQGTVDTTVPVSMKRTPTTARLTVSAAKDDSVAIDGSLVAMGRWEGALPAGEHTVNVAAQGKKPYQITLDLPAGTVRTVQVTLEDESRAGGAVWPWVLGGVVLAGGAAVGGYFLLKPKDTPGNAPSGTLGGAVVVPAVLRGP